MKNYVENASLAQLHTKETNWSTFIVGVVCGAVFALFLFHNLLGNATGVVSKTVLFRE